MTPYLLILAIAFVLFGVWRVCDRLISGLMAVRR